MLAATPRGRQAGHPMLANAAGDDAGVMRKIRVHVQRHAMPGHPAADAHADGADFALPVACPPPRCRPCPRGFSPRTPNRASAAIIHASSPCTNARTSCAGMRAMRDREIQHGIHHPLAGPVIGPLAAAAGLDRSGNGRRPANPPHAPRCRRYKAAGARPARSTPALWPPRIAAMRACMAAMAAS